MTTRLRIPTKRVRGRSNPLQLPRYMTPGAAGFDLCADIDEAMPLPPGARCLVPTGLALQIPEGYEAQVRPRSGLAIKHGVTLLNSPGTIDSDYRGEIQVILINHGQESFTVVRGERIAQLVVARVVQVDLIEVEELEESTRGTGGFGHTGK